MPQVKVTILVEVDGQPVSGFPHVTRHQVEQVVPWNPYVQAAGGLDAFTPIPAPTIGTLQALVMRPSKPITLRFADQSDAGLPLEAGSVFIAFGTALVSGSVRNVTVWADGDTEIRGLAAGMREVPGLSIEPLGLETLEMVSTPAFGVPLDLSGVATSEAAGSHTVTQV